MIKNSISKIVSLSLLIALLLSLAPVSFAEQFGVVRGHITDKNGGPVSGVAITLYNNDYKIAGTTTTDANGIYTFDQVPVITGADIYRIKAVLSTSDVNLEKYTLFFNVYSLQTSTQDIVFETYPPSGKGLLYGVVTSYSDRIVPVQAVVYLSNGMYTFFEGGDYYQWSLNLPTGEYVVWAERNYNNETYRSKNLSVTVRSDDPAYCPIHLPANQQVAYHSQPLPQRNSVYGRVTQKNGLPFEGAVVDLLRQSESGKLELVRQATTNSTGQYQFYTVDVNPVQEKFVVKVTANINGEAVSEESAAFDMYYHNTLGKQHEFEVPFILNVVNTGDLNVISRPSGARVWIDGIDTGKRTPLNASGLSPGQHSVALTMDYYYNDNFSVEVLADNVVTVNRALNESTGNLYISARPVDSMIIIDNKLAGVGVVNQPKKPCGKYQYTISCEGYRNETGIIEVLPGKSVSKEFDLVAVPSFSFTYFTYLLNSMMSSLSAIFS